MAVYQVEMRHTEKTFEALSHMQYDLFCKKSRIIQSILSVALILFGVTRASADGLAILLVACGCFLMTNIYSSANRTAHKLCEQLKENGLPFPASRYVFHKNALEIIGLPEEQRIGDPLPYRDVFRLGEDNQYYYIFRDRYGGYMVPKEELGERSWDFRSFLEERCGQKFQSRRAPLAQLIEKLRHRHR